MNEKDIRKLFEEYGIQPSFHRFKILQFLMENKNHPTVEQIYRHLVKDIPTLSKTTVYNTLRYFVSKGIVAEIMIEENEVRYDFETTPHIHFKCKKCKNVYDIFMDCDILKKQQIDGHKIEEHHIYLLGICKNCRTIDNNKKQK